MTQTQRATIKDVAREAGVSTAAVSKVLNNAYGVSPEMRARVETTIRDLDYRPSAAARAMRGKTFTIGVLASDIHNPFVALLIDGITEETESAGYTLFVGPRGPKPGAEARVIQTMLDHRMDGLLLISPLASEERLAAIAARVPLIVIGRHGPTKAYDTVAGDDLLGSELLVEHLFTLGHKRIAYLTHRSGLEDDPRLPQRVRQRGYEVAMERRGLQHNIDLLDSFWSYSGGYDAGLALSQRESLPTAVHGGADIAALGLLGALREADKQVPADISVVGYDNIMISAHKPVSMTTVDQSGHEMGADAARLLIERIHGRTDPVAHLIKPRLITRETTAPPP